MLVCGVFAVCEVRSKPTEGMGNDLEFVSEFSTVDFPEEAMPTARTVRALACSNDFILMEFFYCILFIQYI